MEQSQIRLHYNGNLLALISISIVLLIAFYIQIFQNELPCPLCLLQRAAFVGAGVGVILNLRIKARPAHYALILLWVLLGILISLRQIFLHIVPNDPGYGTAIFNLHLYTWSALILLLLMICTIFSLFFEKGFSVLPKKRTSTFVIIVFLVIIAAESLSSFLQCGLNICPPNPIKYQLLQ